jgi:hypothetical protein
VMLPLFAHADSLKETETGESDANFPNTEYGLNNLLISPFPDRVRLAFPNANVVI